MKFSSSTAAALLAAPLLVAAQTFTDCNPLKKTCPPDPALGGSATFDLSQGQPKGFSVAGTAPTYNKDGGIFTVAKKGDNPTLRTGFYMMFGRMEVTLKAAPGQGMVSSLVLQSDDLDEIDWEWLGTKPSEVQTNFFGKGNTATYDRSAWHANPGNQDGFHTYTIDWTKDRIEFIIDGKVIRTVTPDQPNAKNQYPQSPMYGKFGAWAGGDPENSKGTIEWAGGPINYSKGPYTMGIKTIKMVDYSTGKEYVYTDNSGNWQSIKAVDGKVNGSGSPNNAPDVGSSVPSAEPTLPTTKGMNQGGTPTGSPSVLPWLPQSPPQPSTLTPSGTSITGIAGLPTGWLVTDSGRPSTPNSASMTSRTESSPSSAPSSGSISSSGSVTSIGGPKPTSISGRPIPTGTNGTTVLTSRVPTATGSNPGSGPGSSTPSGIVTAPPNAAMRLSGSVSGLLAICGFVGLAVFL